MHFVKKLLDRYNVPYSKNDLVILSTHHSFSEKNNSRYVFLGQFYFKGLVASWVQQNIGGTGTQLQHYLGNILSSKKLELFFEIHIRQGVRMANIADLPNQKHIFANAILGYISEHTSEDKLEEFIFHHFIEPNDAILPKTHLFQNPWQQLQFLGKQYSGLSPKILHSVNEEKLNIFEIRLNNETISSSQSISYKYARKKAIRLGLKYIAEQEEKKLLNDPKFLVFEKQMDEKKQLEIEKNKAIKEQKHLQRIELHQQKMKLKREKEKIESQKLDEKRRIAKQKLKESKEKKNRKGSDSIYREYTIEEIKAMSASKRRNLQDRGIIPKGI